MVQISLLSTQGVKEGGDCKFELHNKTLLGGRDSKEGSKGGWFMKDTKII